METDLKKREAEMFLKINITDASEQDVTMHKGTTSIFQVVPNIDKYLAFPSGNNKRDEFEKKVM